MSPTLRRTLLDLQPNHAAIFYAHVFTWGEVEAALDEITDHLLARGLVPVVNYHLDHVGQSIVYWLVAWDGDGPVPPLS